MRGAPIVPPASPLTDSVVTLRPRREEDLDAIASASHDLETRRWLDDPPMATDEEARAAAMSRTEQAWRSGSAAPLTIADAATDQPIGMINLQFRGPDVAALAYSVFPAHRGRGIAPRAVRLVADWAFGDLGLVKLLLESDEANAASERVAEKCGFQPTGTTSEVGPDGVEHTRVVFSRDR